jgi:hypothetical protein
VTVHLAGVLGFEGLTQVHGNLVTKEVEVHPGVGAPTLLAAHHIAVKAAGGVEVGDIESKVK